MQTQRSHSPSCKHGREIQVAVSVHTHHEIRQRHEEEHNGSTSTEPDQSQDQDAHTMVLYTRDHLGQIDSAAELTLSSAARSHPAENRIDPPAGRFTQVDFRWLFISRSEARLFKAWHRAVFTLSASLNIDLIVMTNPQPLQSLDQWLITEQRALRDTSRTADPSPSPGVSLRLETTGSDYVQWRQL